MPTTPKLLRVAHRAATAGAVAALFVGLLGAAASGLPILDGPVLTPDPTTTTTIPLIGDTLEPVLAPVVGSPSTTSTTAPPAPPASSEGSTSQDPTQPASSSEAPAEDAAATTETSAPVAAPTRPVAATPKESPATPRPAGAAPGVAVAPAAPIAVAPPQLPVAAPGSVGAAASSARSVVFLESPSSPLLPKGGRTSMLVLNKLAGLQLAPAVIARLLAPFPVAGPATYSDDWGAVRLVPELHLHEGTDIFAARGTPVIASADGVVSRLTVDSPIGGTSLRLTAPGGSFFYYAHLDRLAPTLSEGKRVQRGDVLGFVGSTGNAQGTSPHLHYEVHPAGGAAVNPAPYLDKWLAEAAVTATAVQGAPDQVSEALAARPATTVTAAGTRSGSRSTSAGHAPSRSQVPGAGAVALGPLQLASSSAAPPLGLLMALAAIVVVRSRVLRRRRRRRRWAAGTANQALGASLTSRVTV